MKKLKKNTELVEKKESQESSLPKIINSEVNLLVFPFFALDKRKQKGRTKVEYRDVVERGDKKIEILWQVTSNSEYGYPALFDREVHKAIEQIITETLRKNSEVKNPVHLGSLYNLCKRMGIKKYGGFQYREIKKALERIGATRVKSEGTFYQKDKKQWISKSFSLYDAVVFKGEQLKDGAIADTNLLYLSDLYLQSLNCFYIKPIDYNYLQSLKSKIASRLYEILGVKFYGLRNKRQDFICYRYSKLCQLLPITPQRYISLAKQQLDPAHKELKDTEFLFNYEWDQDTGKDWLVYYWSGERAKKEVRKVKTEFFAPPIEEEVLPLLKKKSQTFSETQINLINELVKLNVSEITAKHLVKHSSQQAIRKWIKAINYANPKDKAAYLVKAIKEGWQVPEEYLKAEEREKREKEQEKARLAKEKKEKEERKRKQKEAEKLDKIYNSLGPLQQKEVKKEIKNRLSVFWRKQLEKKTQNKEISKLTKSALENKKREVIKDWIASGKVESENSKA
ncbi:hypothetical protein ES702_01540 [subsurface metagenome]